MEATTTTRSSPTVGPVAAAVVSVVVAALGVAAALSTEGWDTVVVVCVIPFLTGATWVDLRELRIPNRLNAAFAVTMAATTAVAGGVENSIGSTGRALGAAFAMFAVFLALHAVSPSGFGGGDVKLGFGTGAMLGWMSWTTLLQGALASFLVNGVAAVVVLALSRGRTRELPFGPSIAVGALVAVLVA